MTRSPASVADQASRPALLSIKPKYADLILSGKKRVEFRRTWARSHVNLLILYASTPARKIVGAVEVLHVEAGSSKRLWDLCQQHGGGLTRVELEDYFRGKPQGVAILLGRTFVPDRPVEPGSVIKNFVAPQSYRYLAGPEYLAALKALHPLGA
ncbi:ASCH domain-containing protein [Pelomonas sp. V22]|nr:ASCH domain-containing protein [Pelomonas sp. V22]